MALLDDFIEDVFGGADSAGVESIQNLVDTMAEGDTTASDALSKIKKSLEEGKWPGEGEEPSNFESWKNRFVKDGGLVGIMKDLDFEIDAEGNLTGKVRFKDGGEYFELDTWKMGINGPADVKGGVQYMARNPVLIGGPGDGTYNAFGFFHDKGFTEAQISDFRTNGWIVDEKGPDVLWKGKINGKVTEVKGYNPESLQKGARNILYQRLVNLDKETYQGLVFSKTKEGQMRVILKAGTLGKEVPFGMNQPFETLQEMGAVDEETGNLIQAEGQINAKEASQALQEDTQERFNQGMTKNKGKWTSGCSVAGGTCGVAREVMSTFSDESNLAVTEGTGSGSVKATARANAQAIADIQKGWNGINSATGEENGITGDEIGEKATSKSNTWWGKFKGMFDEDELPKAIKNYNTAFNKALKNFGGGKWYEGDITNRWTSRQDLLGPMFRDKKMLDKITAGLAVDKDVSRAIQILKNNDMSLHSYYEASKGPQGVIIGSLEDAKTLEKIFDDMKGSEAWGKVGDTPPITQNDLDEVMKKWRTTHGLPEDEGWYTKDEKTGKWQCSGGATITHCAGAPKTLEDALNEMLDDGESEGVNKIGEKGSKLLKFLKFFGKYLFYASLLDLLLSHSEAMSGCFLVPLEVRDSNGKVIPSYSNTSYKINALTCKQEMKTWGSGYLLGIPFGKDDWFGSAVFGSSPNSKGGNVQAAPTCLRGGKCDGLSLPTPNFFNCDLPTPGPGGGFKWNPACPPSPCVKDPTSADCHINPGPGNYLKCFPDNNYKSSGGQTYIYDPQKRTCTEYEDNSDRTLYGGQWVNGNSEGTRATDGCNFKCVAPPNAENFEYATPASPSPSCSSTTGAGPCAQGEVCEAGSGRCIPRTQTCLAMGTGQIASPSGSLSQGAAYWQDQKNYCVGGGGGTSGWGINDNTCNPAQDGPLVNCDGTGYNQPIYSNCKVGGVNFATGKSSPDSIFNGYCASQSYQTHTWPSPHFWDIDGLEFNHDTDAPMPLCFNNPEYANPGFNSSTYEITLKPQVQFAANSPHEAKSGTKLNYLTCVKPREYSNTICQTDDDCNDGSEGNKLQICVGSSGGIMPGKGSSSPNTNPGFCVNVQPAPSCKPSPSQPCFKDSRGNSYHGQCAKNTGVNLQSCNSGFLPSQGLDGNTLPQICVNPGISDTSKAKGGENLGTRGICLSVGPGAVRNHMGATSTDPDPCSDDTADTCSKFCNSYGLNAPQVPPGFTLSCQNVGILGAAADWLERSVNIPDLGDSFGGLVHVLMWIGIALGIGIVILGILSLFMKRLERSLFGWMG